VQETYGLRTKREAVDFALRRLLVAPRMVTGEHAPRMSLGWLASTTTSSHLP
jgi:Arc/MetJ family transcription regulator